MEKLRLNKVNTIDLQDFDELVVKTYGRRYSFQQQDGCKSRGTESFTVPIEDPYDFKTNEIPEEVNGEEMGISFAAWLARDPKQEIKGQKYDYQLDLFWERNFYPSLDMVVNDLHSKGLIDEGEYMIIIDW